MKSASEPCSCEGCGFQGSTVRRVNMRYLTKKQRAEVIDISQKLEIIAV